MVKAKLPSFVAEFTKLLKRYPRIRRNGLAILIGVGSLILLYLVYSLAYFGRVYPNVYIGSSSFAGLKLTQVQNQLQQLIDQQPLEPITLLYQDRSHQILPADVEWAVDIETSAKSLIAVGRRGSFWRKAWEQLKAPLDREAILAVAKHDPDLLDAKITEIAETIDQRAVQASAKFINDKLVVEREQVGKRINRAEVLAEMMHQWGSFSAGTIILATEFEAPTVVLGSVEELEAEIETLSAATLTLKWPGNRKDLTTREIRQLIGFVGRKPGVGLADQGPSQQILSAEFTDEAIKQYLGELAKSIDKPAKDPKLIIRDGVVAITQVSQEGRVVDLTVSSLAILQALGLGNEPREVELTIKTQTPLVDEANLAALGIKERIGYGETSFAGSPQNRIHNIKNGVSILQSALIKPGQEFSTVGTLGAVDNTTGFLPELVIKENRTTPEFGGGLCQVSTTLFRSAINAGLKITERRNHSYRVGYYEPPIGLDATIYLPRPDLKFLNDTPGHILIQGRVVGSRVIFELWGTSDGRTSSTTTPVVSNIIEPGEPIYVETDTLPKGEQKQVEKPHAGATAVVTYTVTRDGQVINKQTFKSVYKVWPARFLVGTNESLPPTTPPA